MSAKSDRELSAEQRLEQVAWEALRRAHAPYSGFSVGAALAVEGGGAVPGCNVENSSLGLGLCAERVALFSAFARGLSPGRLMVVVTDSPDPTPPCGACRQVLRELAPQVTVLSVARSGNRKRWSSAELLSPPVRSATGAGPCPGWIISRKRDGHSLATEQIRALVRGLLDGDVEEYQMTAFMMAVLLKGMDQREIRDLTTAMLASGARLDLREMPGPRIDKHSTGGVGDKTSLAILPLVLAAGVRVPMISGRGLGHTGGTLDKLESIPGYQTALSMSRLQDLMRSPGGFVAGQTAELVPADRIMYALRDVSATVSSVPLIVSSILSKKLSAGLTGLVLDVKFGRGAFMPDRPAAEDLARTLVQVGGSLGLPAVALLTRMDEPLGQAVGNALEVREMFSFLAQGESAHDLRELTLSLGGLMVALGGLASTMAEGVRIVQQKRESGEARDACIRWIEAQGGDAAVVRDPESLPVAARRRNLRSNLDGYVQGVDARLAGDLCVQLGGGRRKAGDSIDHGVGLVLHRKRGDRVRRNDSLATIFLPSGMPESFALPDEDHLVRVGPDRPAPQKLIEALVTREGIFDDPWNVPVSFGGAGSTSGRAGAADDRDP